jgi:outer membrane murein-binding lipoprotein Lpp
MATNFTPPPPNASMEENIRFLIQAAVETHTLLATNQARISKVEEEVVTLRNDVKQLKEIVNNREQQVRNLTVRLSGICLTEEERLGPDPAAAAAKNAYERVIRPLLQAAKSCGKISSTPNMANIITKAFRTSKPPSSPNAPPPPIIIHLSSAAYKSAILSMRKESLPKPNDAEKSIGIKRLYLSEDLTPPTHTLLKKLKDDKRTSRVWTVDGQIRFVKDGDPNSFVHKVRSVFDPIETILS